MLATMKRLAAVAVVAMLVGWNGGAASTAGGPKKAAKHAGRGGMSAMGRAAGRARAALEVAAGGGSHKDFEESEVCVNDPECEGDGKEPFARVSVRLQRHSLDTAVRTRSGDKRSVEIAVRIKPCKSGDSGTVISSKTSADINLVVRRNRQIGNSTGRHARCAVHAR